MPRTKGARRPLAMDVESPPRSVDDVILNLAGVVRDVAQHPQIGPRQYSAEDLPHQMGQNLPIGQRAVDRRTHRAKV